MPEHHMTVSKNDTHSLLASLYEKYSRYVYKLAWQYCDNPSDVDDLVQEVWLKLCTKGDILGAFSKERQVSYIAAATRNTAISMARKAVVVYPLESANALSYDEAEILNTLLDRRLKIQHFQKAWILVPSQERELLERKYLLKESDIEIAQAIGISTNSVRMYLTRARKTALAVLAEHREKFL